MCGSSRSYLHSAHVENKAVVPCALRGAQREPKSGLGKHPEGGLIQAFLLVPWLFILANQVCSQPRKWLKEVRTVNTLKLYAILAFASVSARIFLWEWIQDPQG